MELGDLRQTIELIANRQIEEAMQGGVFDDLPGKGKPLPLDEDGFVPPELRPAVRLLKSAGVLPDWLQRAKEIETARQNCERHFEKAAQDYARYAQDLPTRFRAWYASTLSSYYETMRKVNRLILQFNMTAPVSVRIELPYRVQERLECFQAMMPCPEGLDVESLLRQHTSSDSLLKESVRMSYRQRR